MPNSSYDSKWQNSQCSSCWIWSISSNFFLYYLNNKKKITIIDCGLTKNSKLEKEDNYQNPRINKNNLFAVNNFKKINNIVTNNFKLKTVIG